MKIFAEVGPPSVVTGLPITSWLMERRLARLGQDLRAFIFEYLAPRKRRVHAGTQAGNVVPSLIFE